MPRSDAWNLETAAVQCGDVGALLNRVLRNRRSKLTRAGKDRIYREMQRIDRAQKFFASLAEELRG